MKKIKLLLIMLLTIVLSTMLYGCSGDDSVSDDFQPVDNQPIDTQTVDLNETENEASKPDESVNGLEELPEIAIITKMNGDVLIERNGEGLVAHEGLEILIDDIIMVGENSGTEIMIGEDKLITLGENSILLYSVTGELSENKKITLAIKMGTCIIDIDGSLDEHTSFEIMSPAQITSIRGTVASISYDPVTQDSNILFFEGSGLVADVETGKVSAITAGQSVTTTNGVFVYSVISEDNLNDVNLKYIEDNLEVFEACLDIIETSEIDLTEEPIVEDSFYDYSPTTEMLPTEFYESTTEIEKKFNENQKGKKDQLNQKDKKEKPNPHENKSNQDKSDSKGPDKGDKKK